ncbi:MAG: right-handed parallel beta-helix repeat-containing protein [Candidatus Bathyarchaeia archaeon]|jgi:hypothetical protein
MSKSKWAILLAVVLLVASGAVFVNYFIHYPAPLGAIVVPTDYPTIQAAINNSSPGSTIYVRNGVYNELLVIDKPLTLIGESRQNTVIKGYNIKSATFNTVIIQANNVSISNFMVTGSSYGIGITDNASNCQITNNNIEGYLTGVGVNGNNHIVTGNNISECLVWGLTCYGSNVLISENEFENCSSGVFVQASNVTVEKNTFDSGSKYSVDEYDDGGIILTLGGPYIVYGNTLKGLNIGIVYEGASRSLVYNNSIIQNLVGITLINYRFIDSTSGGMDNIFFSNNLIDNQRQAVVETTAHGTSALMNGTDVVSWDNGVIGNYWSDYQSRYPEATQNNAAGTYNTPYLIDGTNKDNHPLVQEVKT